jgi:hypothetical protein
LKETEQVLPQLIWLGCVGLLVLVTVPVPAPGFVTVSVKVVIAGKVTLTVLLLFMVTMHLLLASTELHPLQLVPVLGVAVSVTVAPWVNATEQVLPQLIWLGCVGLLVLITVPVPVLVTVSVKVGWVTPTIEHANTANAVQPINSHSFRRYPAVIDYLLLGK